MARHDFQLSAPAQSEAVELAAEEGHDTDIPSNLGIIKGPGADDLDKEFDIEKCELSSRTSQSGPSDEFNVPAEAANPNVIGWNGDDDPENPLNWPSSKRWGTVAIVSSFTFLTPLGSAMFAPGVPQIMEEFGSSSELLAGFVVSVYVLGFAFGPLGKLTQVTWISYSHLTASSCCPFVGDVWPTTALSRLQLPLHSFQYCLRPQHQS